MRSMNMTETSLKPTNNVPVCPMYRISAWNAGGEGELSEPVQEITPRGKQLNQELSELINQVFANSFNDLYLYKWMLYAPAKYQSSFSSL